MYVIRLRDEKTIFKRGGECEVVGNVEVGVRS